MSDYTGVGLVHALCVCEDATLMSNNNGGCTQLGVQPPPWLQSGAGSYSAPLEEESLHHTGNYSAPLGGVSAPHWKLLCTTGRAGEARRAQRRARLLLSHKRAARLSCEDRRLCVCVTS